MKQLHYELHYFDNPNYPIIFHFNSLIRNESEILPHWHANIELLYIVSGKAIVYIDDQTIIAKRGEIVIINSNSIHSIESQTDEVIYFCLIMDSNFCRSLNFDTINCRFHNLTSDPEMRNIFQIIANECDQAKPYYQKAVRALCNTMLILLYRNQLIEATPGASLKTERMAIIKQSIEYIHHHFNRDLSLDEISQEVGISKYYFCRIFKDITGITVNNYIFQVRCNHAHQLLSESDLSIAECSEVCGFNSTAYFTKCFKSVFGFPPSQIRKKHQDTEKKSRASESNQRSVFIATNGQKEPTAL
ncbi:AraC family transcriptional regulator [Erysipelothrix tonsillarum]|uniref:AraC family transcriptional regulator n=1 Tax=Erysipelothrix tonsillarum TaxID=38402 RepID=UPI00038088E2|nr:AraC family transcriptional regulator [Erysipelothrix tonsillarum]